ncbi:MAG: hypothetical protein LKE46_01665 [Clostridium sp.]|jgi:hypothetical protein|uniref:hypothetical protein n=1 Tax=Clostridium sp. TaxID=1506 RepID=UPI0025C4326E|nr:hypothetical protein [Clostridium sp.]MCH3962957.1 hypothetical protein [Clostridium sp.]MCI1800166.1 hypothetical protein [Clostridium sp.]MCI2200161.1 hypothetical protein [Clostridium sp.]
MDDLRFKILEVKKNPDVTVIRAQCTKDHESVTASIPTMGITDRDFIKRALKNRYLNEISEQLQEGETI